MDVTLLVGTIDDTDTLCSEDCDVSKAVSVLATEIVLVGVITVVVVVRSGSDDDEGVENISELMMLVALPTIDDTDTLCSEDCDVSKAVSVLATEIVLVGVITVVVVVRSGSDDDEGVENISELMMLVALPTIDDTDTLCSEDCDVSKAVSVLATEIVLVGVITVVVVVRSGSDDDEGVENISELMMLVALPTIDDTDTLCSEDCDVSKAVSVLATEIVLVGVITVVVVVRSGSDDDEGVENISELMMLVALPTIDDTDTLCSEDCDVSKAVSVLATEIVLVGVITVVVVVRSGSDDDEGVENMSELMMLVALPTIDDTDTLCSEDCDVSKAVSVLATEIVLVGVIMVVVVVRSGSDDDEGVENISELMMLVALPMLSVTDGRVENLVLLGSTSGDVVSGVVLNDKEELIEKAPVGLLLDCMAGEVII